MKAKTFIEGNLQELGKALNLFLEKEKVTKIPALTTISHENFNTLLLIYQAAQKVW